MGCLALWPRWVRVCLFDESGAASERQTGQVPIIRAPRGNAAEMIAKKVETKIRDSIITASRSQGSTSLFSQEQGGLSTLQRPRKCASRCSTHVQCRLTYAQFSSSLTVTSILSHFSHMVGHIRPSSLIASK